MLSGRRPHKRLLNTSPEASEPGILSQLLNQLIPDILV
ncbi:protein of unknown function [Burkholderia multivorans]